MTVLLEVPTAADVAELRRNPAYRVLGILTPEVPAPVPVRRKWAGSISSATADLLLREVEDSRNEWERSF